MEGPPGNQNSDGAGKRDARARCKPTLHHGFPFFVLREPIINEPYLQVQSRERKTQKHKVIVCRSNKRYSGTGLQWYLQVVARQAVTRRLTLLEERYMNPQQ